MITEKEVIRHIRLKDLYDKDFKYYKEIEMWEQLNPRMWVDLWNWWIAIIVKERIEKKIRQYKNYCKKKNKKQYLLSYKIRWKTEN